MTTTHAEADQTARIDAAIWRLQALISSAHMPDGVQLSATAEAVVISTINTLKGAHHDS